MTVAASHPGSCPCLSCAVERHRDLYRSDVWIKHLVARQPPTLIDRRLRIPRVEDGAQVGMTMGGQLLVYLGHPEEYGSRFPWTRALWELRGWCRSGHRYHRRADAPYWRGALCHEAVRFVVVREWSPYNASRILRYPRLEPLLAEALAYLDERIDAARERQELHAKEAAGRYSAVRPVLPYAHHAVPGLHLEDCPQCSNAG